MIRHRDCIRLSRREYTLHGRFRSVLLDLGRLADKSIGRQTLLADQARRSANSSNEITRITWIGKLPSS
jgi:hypothetical protein